MIAENQLENANEKYSKILMPENIQQ